MEAEHEAAQASDIEASEAPADPTPEASAADASAWPGEAVAVPASSMPPPASIAAIVVVGLLSFAGGFALLFTSFLSTHPLLPRIVGSLTGGAALGITAAYAQRLPKWRRPAAFAGGIATALYGGPLSLAATLFVVGLQDGAGFGAIAGAIIIAFLGIMCGWFISLPIGLALGASMALVSWVADLLLSRRSRV